MDKKYLLALLDAQPFDFMLLLALADWEEENGRADHARAWRRLESLGILPNQIGGKWLWFRAGIRGKNICWTFPPGYNSPLIPDDTYDTISTGTHQTGRGELSELFPALVEAMVENNDYAEEVLDYRKYPA